MPHASSLSSRFGLRARLLVLAGVSLLGASRAALGAAETDPIVKARQAYQQRDRAGLAALRKSTAEHPLAMWVDYWDLSLRLRQLNQSDLEAFYSRWSDTAVQARLRKEWIVERGKRGDAAALALELPRLRAAGGGAGANASPEEREVECYALLQRHAAGEDVAAGARALWFAQREADHGCAALASALYQAGHLSRDDVWARARLAAEQGRRFVAQHAVGLLGTLKMEQVHQSFLQPARYLARHVAKPTPDEAELTVLAVTRLAARSPSAAAAALRDPHATPLAPELTSAAWAALAKEAALQLRPQAFEWYQRAAQVAGGANVAASPETLAWQVRTALRDTGDDDARWQMVLAAVDAMGDPQRADPTWIYWKARALQALAPPGPAGDAKRAEARQLLVAIATRLHYYGALAAQELGQEPHLPQAPTRLTDAERAQAREHPGLARGLALFALRLREEGQAEWNHALAEMDDRMLRSAAQLACDAEVWNVCMLTSERTRSEIDMAQRFPMPFREHVDAAARESDIDAARVYAVIRQESNFSVAARSVAGAAGLMQLMPQTARWVAGRFRIPYQRERIHDPALNVRIGTRYLKLVLNAFDGSHALAAAAYNAGPSRPRRWSKAGVDDTPGWIEVIPIAETRDYVKNVLANAASYRALLAAPPAKPRAAAPTPAIPTPTAQVLAETQD